MTKPAKTPPSTAPAAPAKPGRGAGDDKAPAAKPARRQRVAPEPTMLTEKIFVRSRPDRVYFSAINPANRQVWDKNVGRFRFVKPSKTEPAATKVSQGVTVEAFFPMKLGGLFHLRYALIRQPQGFALEATRGSFGLLAGLAESWAFVPFKGGTEVQFTRSLAPRFKPLQAYVERTQRVAMRQTLEGLRKFAETQAK
jgi:hypothetical protein